MATCFDEEISISKPLLDLSTSILGVWVNHVMIHKNITLYYQNKNKNKKHEGSVLGKPLLVSSGRDLRVSCFIFIFDNIGLYFYALFRGSPTHPI